MIQECLGHQAEYLPSIHPHRNEGYPVGIALIMENSKRIPSRSNVGQYG